MMSGKYKVGLTGGIGSGKTFCADIFREIGIPVYESDSEAKKLMISDSSIQNGLINLFGKEVYHEDGSLNRKLLGSKIFQDESLRESVNQIVHPAVRNDFSKWAEEQTKAPYVIQESALLYEIGAEKFFDAMIVVDAPIDIRIERVMARDQITREEVLHRIKSQMPASEKKVKADYIIVNDHDTPLIRQIIEAHLAISSLTQDRML